MKVRQQLQDKGLVPDGGARSAARLQQEERAFLDRELDVLHVAVVHLQPLEASPSAARTPPASASAARRPAGRPDPPRCAAPGHSAPAAPGPHPSSHHDHGGTRRNGGVRGLLVHFLRAGLDVPVPGSIPVSGPAALGRRPTRDWPTDRTRSPYALATPRAIRTSRRLSEAGPSTWRHRRRHLHLRHHRPRGRPTCSSPRPARTAVPAPRRRRAGRWPLATRWPRRVRP